MKHTYFSLVITPFSLRLEYLTFPHLALSLKKHTVSGVGFECATLV